MFLAVKYLTLHSVSDIHWDTRTAVQVQGVMTDDLGLL